MGKYQRDKGKRGEQEIVNVLKNSGVPAKRISMLETGGIDKGDVEVAGCWKAQVKIGKQVPEWIYKIKSDAEVMSFVKRDYKQWKIIMDLDFFLEHFI